MGVGGDGDFRGHEPLVVELHLEHGIHVHAHRDVHGDGSMVDAGLADDDVSAVDREEVGIDVARAQADVAAAGDIERAVDGEYAVAGIGPGLFAAATFTVAVVVMAGITALAA